MSSADATIEMERKIPQKKRKGWTLEQYHPFDNRELAERFPAHIGGARTSILPALPKKERWEAKWPDDFGTTPYTFGYNQDYPTPSDKQIVREIQIRNFAKELSKRLDIMPKDELIRRVQKGWAPVDEPIDFPILAEFEREALERALGSPEGYSLGRLAYPRGFKHLPLPRNKKPWDYYDSLKSGATKLTGWR